MPKPPLPESVSQLLAQPNPAVIVTVRPDGQPVSVPTWYLWEDGQILLSMDESRKRLPRLRTNPRVALTVLAADNWAIYVTLQGRVVKMHPDVDLADTDRVSQHYDGQPFGVRHRPRFSAWIEVERWHGRDARGAMS